MNTHNEETIVSINDFTAAIKEFIKTYPQNITIWRIDDKTVSVQLSNIGIRDKLFPRLAYLANNTSIENNLSLFDTSAKMCYVSDRIIRFNCTLNELLSFLESNKITSDSENTSDSKAPMVISPIEKFVNRLSTTNIIKHAKTIINNNDTNINVGNNDSSITVYVIGKPEAHQLDEKGHNCQYVTWEILSMPKITVGTTWGDEALREKLRKLRKSLKILTDLEDGDYGTFNMVFGSGGQSFYQLNVLIEKGPLFVLDSTYKVGSIIDSRNYKKPDIWHEDIYQKNVQDYPKYSDFADKYSLKSNMNIIPKNSELLIPNGAIIII